MGLIGSFPPGPQLSWAFVSLSARYQIITSPFLCEDVQFKFFSSKIRRSVNNHQYQQLQG
jgi:hypothetical protein